MTETEYLGRVINSNGWKYSDKRKAEILDFRLPRQLGELKSFIDFCELFRSHINLYAEIMKPFHNAQQGNKKQYRSTCIDMTKEQREAYVKIQQTITQRATLYFVDDHDPITLQTDASDYGIGAYLT